MPQDRHDSLIVAEMPDGFTAAFRPESLYGPANCNQLFQSDVAVPLPIATNCYQLGPKNSNCYQSLDKLFHKEFTAHMDNKMFH